MDQFPSLYDIQQAAGRIKPYIHRTPVLTSQNLNRLTGSFLFFKCENFQKAGAFKTRGAVNAVFSLSGADLKRGVATHSSGNHAAALSRAAKLKRVAAHIVMPETSSSVKIRAVQNYDGNITFCKPTLESREDTLNEVLKKTGAVQIHPYNDPRIIAGQATAMLELIGETGNLDYILAPVGGGGLISGTALSTSYIAPQTTIIAAEPKGADDAYRSLLSGKLIPSSNPNTIADGLLTSLGSLTFPIIKKHVSEILTVSDEAIIQAMMLIWERMKIVIEPSSAVPFAAVMENNGKFRDKRVGIILSGGNTDLEKLPWIKK